MMMIMIMIWKHLLRLPCLGFLFWAHPPSSASRPAPPGSCPTRFPLAAKKHHYHRIANQCDCLLFQLFVFSCHFTFSLPDVPMLLGPALLALTEKWEQGQTNLFSSKQNICVRWLFPLSVIRFMSDHWLSTLSPCELSASSMSPAPWCGLGGQMQ